MIISFTNTPLVLASVVGLLILAVHLFSAFLRVSLSRILTPLGVVLHVIGAVLLFFAGAGLDLTVACLLVSVFVYSLSAYIAAWLRKGGRLR